MTCQYYRGISESRNHNCVINGLRLTEILLLCIFFGASFQFQKNSLVDMRSLSQTRCMDMQSVMIFVLNINITTMTKLISGITNRYSSGSVML